MKTERKRKRGRVLMVLGVLFIVAAAGLTVSNILQERRAEAAALEVVHDLVPDIEEQAQIQHELGPTIEEANLLEAPNEYVVPDYILNPDKKMPTITVDGYKYIGTISIPVLGLELPVMDRWDYTRLRIAPCYYYGSVYKDNMVIAAHNYPAHFGQIKTLQSGDSVIFTDAEGNVFSYTVAEMEVLQPTAVKAMVHSDCDLTLFTCTIGGRTRVTVRCLRAD